MASQYVKLPATGGIQQIESASPELVVTGTGATRTLTLNLSDVVVQEAASVVNTFTAGETISALQLVYMNDDGLIYVASQDTVKHASVLGIAKTSGTYGESVDVLQYGLLTDPFLDFQNNSLLFLGAVGEVTDVANGSGYMTRVGRQIFTNTILILIEPAVAL